MPAHTQPAAGSRRVAQRVVRTLLLLQERPRSAVELAEAVREASGDGTYGDRPIYALRRDLQCLREAGFTVRYDRASGAYRLEAAAFTVQLGDGAVRALGMLRTSFGPGVPHAAEVQDLISQVAALLPQAAQRLLARTPPLHLDLASVDVVPPSAELIGTLERAISGGVRVRFRYRAAGQPGVVDREVEPHMLAYRQGHLYLRGYSVEAEDDREYRVDRIENGTAEILPVGRPPGRRSPRRYRLRYRVSPSLAKDGVSERFLGQQTELLPDGGAVVSADVESLFWAETVLLKYGDQVEVLDPPRLRDSIRVTISRMAALYAEHDPKSRPELCREHAGAHIT